MDPATLAKALAADVVTFASPSTVKAWVKVATQVRVHAAQHRFRSVVPTSPVSPTPKAPCLEAGGHSEVGWWFRQ